MLYLKYRVPETFIHVKSLNDSKGSRLSFRSKFLKRIRFWYIMNGIIEQCIDEGINSCNPKLNFMEAVSLIISSFQGKKAFSLALPWKTSETFFNNDFVQLSRISIFIISHLHGYQRTFSNINSANLYIHGRMMRMPLLLQFQSEISDESIEPNNHKDR